MRRILVFIIGFCFSFLSCTKEEVNSSMYENCLYLNVNCNGVPVKGAMVYTHPETNVGRTDAAGVYQFNGTTAQIYSVFAYAPAYGGAVKVIDAQQGSNSIDLNLSSSVVPDEIPRIELLSPDLPAEVLSGQTVHVKVKVQDKNEVEDHLKLIVSSEDKDELAVGYANAEGYFEADINTLSSGIHQLSVQVENTKGLFNTVFFELHNDAPAGCQLLSANSSRGTVHLQWEKSTDSGFAKYELYAAGDSKGTIGVKKLTTITNADVTTYVDRLPLLYPEVYYFIKVRSQSGLCTTSNSLKVVKPFPGYLDILPDKAWLSNDGHSLFLFEKAGQKLLKVNVNSLIVDHQITLPDAVVDGDVSDDDQSIIYMVTKGGTIYGYSTEDLSGISEMSYDYPVYSMMCLGNDRILFSLDSYSGWGKSIQVVNSQQKEIIYTGGYDERLVFKKIPGKMAALSLTTNLMPVDMTYYEWDRSGVITVMQDDTQHGDHPLGSGIFSISERGNYVITHSDGAIYTTDQNMTFLGQLFSYNQDYAMTIGCYAINEESKVVYGGTKYKGMLVKYDLDNRNMLSQQVLRGFPKFILPAGDEMLIISQTNTYPRKTILEFVER